MKQFTIDGITYKQVQKRTAERMFNEGMNICIVPCKANPHSPWLSFSTINNQKMTYGYNSANEQGNAKKELFHNIINQYEYYNCNSELGSYASYYITE